MPSATPKTEQAFVNKYWQKTMMKIWAEKLRDTKFSTPSDPKSKTFSTTRRGLYGISKAQRRRKHGAVTQQPCRHCGVKAFRLRRNGDATKDPETTNFANRLITNSLHQRTRTPYFPQRAVPLTSTPLTKGLS